MRRCAMAMVRDGEAEYGARISRARTPPLRRWSIFHTRWARAFLFRSAASDARAARRRVSLHSPHRAWHFLAMAYTIPYLEIGCAPETLPGGHLCGDQSARRGVARHRFERAGHRRLSTG